MERKIGEKFEYGGEWFECVEGNEDCKSASGDSCLGCRSGDVYNRFGNCLACLRDDNKNVCFVKTTKPKENKTMEYGKIYNKEGKEIEGARMYLGKDTDGVDLFYGDEVKVIRFDMRHTESTEKVIYIDESMLYPFKTVTICGKPVVNGHSLNDCKIKKIRPKKKRIMSWREALRHLDKVGGKIVANGMIKSILEIDILLLGMSIPPEYKLTRDYGITIEEFPEVDE